MIDPAASRVDELRRLIGTFDAADLALVVAFAGERLLRLQVAAREGDPLLIAQAMRERETSQLAHSH